MEAKVPQRIDMEDKIIGPLTLQQFFYLLFGGLFIYLVNNWTIGSLWRFIYYPIALVVGLLSFALAFVKVQERPFIHFLGSVIVFFIKPQRRVWRRGAAQKPVKIVDQAAAKPAVGRKALDRTRLQEVVKVLDTGDG